MFQSLHNNIPITMSGKLHSCMHSTNVIGPMKPNTIRWDISMWISWGPFKITKNDLFPLDGVPSMVSGFFASKSHSIPTELSLSPVKSIPPWKWLSRSSVNDSSPLEYWEFSSDSDSEMSQGDLTYSDGATMLWKARNVAPLCHVLNDCLPSNQEHIQMVQQWWVKTGQVALLHHESLMSFAFLWGQNKTSALIDVEYMEHFLMHITDIVCVAPFSFFTHFMWRQWDWKQAMLIKWCQRWWISADADVCWCLTQWRIR